MLFERNPPVLIEGHALGFEDLALDFIASRGLARAHLSLGIDHPEPGDVVCPVAQCCQRVPHLARTTRKSRQSGDLPISRDPARRNSRNHRTDPLVLAQLFRRHPPDCCAAGRLEVAPRETSELWTFWAIGPARTRTRQRCNGVVSCGVQY